MRNAQMQGCVGASLRLPYGYPPLAEVSSDSLTEVDCVATKPLRVGLSTAPLRFGLVKCTRLNRSHPLRLLSHQNIIRRIMLID